MKTKTFDAVEMKRRAQQKIAEEDAGLSPSERRAKRERWLEESDDEMAVYWRKGIQAQNEKK